MASWLIFVSYVKNWRKKTVIHDFSFGRGTKPGFSPMRKPFLHPVVDQRFEGCGKGAMSITHLSNGKEHVSPRAFAIISARAFMQNTISPKTW
jgi:hypothetical protein